MIEKGIKGVVEHKDISDRFDLYLIMALGPIVKRATTRMYYGVDLVNVHSVHERGKITGFSFEVMNGFIAKSDTIKWLTWEECLTHDRYQLRDLARFLLQHPYLIDEEYR